MAKVLNNRVLSLLVAVALAVAGLPLAAAATPALATAPNRMLIHPATQTVAPGASFTVQVRMDTTVATTAAQADITFDHDLVEVTAVTAGNMYTGGMFLFGVAPQTLPEAIAWANANGTLRNFAIALIAGEQAPVTGGVFLNIAMRARPGVTGTAPVTLSRMLVSDGGGLPVTMTPVPGEVVIPGPARDMPDLIVESIDTAWEDKAAGTYKVTFTVKNQGKATAAASTTAILIDGIAKPVKAIPALAAGASEARTVGPFTLTEGSDTIKVIADSLNVLSESDGGNNALERTLLSMPDLIVHNVVTAWVVEGETYNVHLNVRNVGRVRSPASTAAILIDDTEVATADIPALDPGKSHPPILVGGGPFTLTEGSDTITVVADTLKVVTELREDNNIKVVTELREDTRDTTGVGEAVYADNNARGAIGVGEAVYGDPVSRPDHRLFIYPATQTVRPGEIFTVRVMQDTPGGSKKATATFRFDQLRVEVTDVALGAAYTGAVFSHGDISAANRDAFLVVEAAMPKGEKVPAGEQEFLVITMRVRDDLLGREITARLTLLSDELTVVGPAGELIRPAGTGAEVLIVIREAPWGIIGGVIGGAALVAGIVSFALQRKKRRLD